jgi:hypothetical protein
MRRILVAVAVAGVLSGSTVFAQDTTEDTKVQVVGQTSDTPMNAFGIQYHSNLAFPAGAVQYQPGVTLVYERAFSDLMSLAIQPGLLFFTGGIGLAADFDLRFHLIGESLNGLYIGPTAGFIASTVGAFTPGFDVGAIVGYNYLINDMIQIGAGVGFTYGMLFTPAGSVALPAIPIRVTVAFAF